MIVLVEAMICEEVVVPEATVPVQGDLGAPEQLQDKPEANTA